MSKSKKVFVIGGGPSLVGFDFEKLRDKDTIVVNHAIFDVPEPNYFVTMDYLWLNKSGIQPKTGDFDFNRRDLFLNTTAEKYFILGFSPPRLEHRGVMMYYDIEWEQVYDLRLFDHAIIASKYGGMGTIMEDFRCASDSGYSALQLAVILGYEEIYLLGMDYTVSNNITHYKEECNRNNAQYYLLQKLNLFLDAYPQAFVDIEQKTRCQVTICSDISRLRAYRPYLSTEEALSNA
jgi:hypothetical protein